MCGEQYTSFGQYFIILGSSPRVRGTGNIAILSGYHEGIIPACAGNSKSASYPTASIRDHPRVCGEQIDGADYVMRRMGSSPRVRGTAYRFEQLLAIVGIIPACAGNRE